MQMFRATLILCAIFNLIALSAFETSFAGATDQPEKTVPQGNDPPGPDNGVPLPPRQDGEVIPPPPIGDEGIYTDAPNPDAGHDKEVIPPPPSPNEESGGNPR
jgi:hypothetical protein